MKVDCAFKFQKSQWGVLGDDMNPAGIIYLDLGFHQPVDCQLKYAVITITLENTEDTSMRSNHKGRDVVRNAPLHLKPWFGPQQLFGQSKDVLTTKKSSMSPYAQVMGLAEVGGVGQENEYAFIQESRWSLSGNLLAGKSTCLYKTVQWQLTESDLEPQPLHGNIIHTAFSFAHDGHPFFMRVEVNGKLKSMKDRVMHRLHRFSSTITNDESYAITLIDLEGWETYKKPLDEIARGLRFAMERENFEEVPIVVPKPQNAEFRDDRDAMPPEELKTRNRIDRNVHRLPSDERRQRRRLTDRTHPALQAPPTTQTRLLEDELVDEVSRDPTRPTPENFVRAFDALTAPKTTPPTWAAQVNLHEGDIPSTSLAEGVEKDYDMVGRGLATIELHKEKDAVAQADLDAVLAVRRMSGLLSIIRMIARFLSYAV